MYRLPPNLRWSRQRLSVLVVSRLLGFVSIFVQSSGPVHLALRLSFSVRRQIAGNPINKKEIQMTWILTQKVLDRKKQRFIQMVKDPVTRGEEMQRQSRRARAASIGVLVMAVMLVVFISCGIPFYRVVDIILMSDDWIADKFGSLWELLSGDYAVLVLVLFLLIGQSLSTLQQSAESQMRVLWLAEMTERGDEGQSNPV
jgi:hypothetical protein